MVEGPLVLSYRGQTYHIGVSCDMSLASLAELIEQATGALDCTIKLLVPGQKAVLLRDQPQRKLLEAGLAPGSRAMMLATSRAAVQQVQLAATKAAEARLPGFDRELMQAAARRGQNRVAGQDRLPKGPWTFGDYRAWESPVRMYPPRGQALSLLHRLAADPGIVHVMVQRQWRVGCLSEMPPEGQVGISPVCVLGLNVNMGQEILLRLRTDDLRGFRKYESIRDTLIHELTHMVHSDHDIAFKTLNSELKREVLQLSSANPGRNLLGSLLSISSAGTQHWGFLGDGDQEVWDGKMGRGRQRAGQTLGTGEGQAPRLAAGAAAAEAALRRSAAATSAAAAAHTPGSADGRTLRVDAAQGSLGTPLMAGEVPGAVSGSGPDLDQGAADSEAVWRSFERQDEATQRDEEAVRRLEED